MRTVFGWPIYSDVSVSYTPTFSNGTWSSTLPLVNLQSRQLSKMARSTAATTASAKFDCDLGVARAIGVIALPTHNFTTAALVRVRGASDSGFAAVVYDSGWVAGWPPGLTAEQSVGLNVSFFLAPSTAQTARYWRVEIDDTANSAGYIQFGRLILAGLSAPEFNPSYGATMSVETDTIRTVTDGGSTLYDVKPIRRTAQFSIENVAAADAWARHFRMLRLVGTSGQMFFLWDADDSTYGFERSFLCTMRELSPIEYSSAAYHKVAYSLVEEL